MAAVEQSLTEAPLPAGWDEAFFGKSNTRYFIDHVNKATTLEDPRLAQLGLPRTKKETKRKVKLPKYKDDLYSKTRRFTTKLRSMQSDDGQLSFTINRTRIFDDSYEWIVNLDPITLTRRLFIKFEGEEGLDYGGMSREWVWALTEEFFKPERHLFVSHAKGYYFLIDKNSKRDPRHLSYFYFVGLILGLAIYHGKLFFGHFGIPFYKALLGQPVVLEDLKSYDEAIHASLKKIQQCDNVEDWDLTFTANDKNEKGEVVTVDLKENGSTTMVNNTNKAEFIDLTIKHYIDCTRDQMDAIRSGLLNFVPRELLEEFEPDEIDLLIGGVEPELADLRDNTRYIEPFFDHTQTSASSSTSALGAAVVGNNNATSSIQVHPVIKLFWEVVASFSSDELRKLVQFATGSDKVPIGGFKHLIGSSGPQLFTISPKKNTDLPTAHSCFNRLELPTHYSDKATLKKELILAISETTGFGLE
jgi:E3 ubiquitin-protein ligase NEDD4